MVVHARLARITLFLAMFFLTILCAPQIFAKNLGTIGNIYPIQEQDLLEFIQGRFSQMQKNGQFAKLKTQMIETVKKHSDRPKPVQNISKTLNDKTFFFDPTFLVKKEIKNAEGAVIVSAGTQVNPLKTVPLRYPLIFFDAEDVDQVRWVKNMDNVLQRKDKLILVKGSILKQNKLFHRSVYFDQEGRLTNKLGIRHVPAMVKQSGLLLEVHEVKP